MAKINVTIRKRASTKGDRQILYLDFYPPVEINGKVTRREYLGLFVYDHPRTVFDREHNTKANEEATMRWLRRSNELIKPEIYNDFELELLRKKEIGEGSFTDFMKKHVLEKQSSNHDNYNSLQKHVLKYAGIKELKFVNITEAFCKGFMKYLKKATAINSPEAKLSRTTSSTYWVIFKTIIRAAYNAGHFASYLKLESLPKDETRRNYLTIDELNTLAVTPCTLPLVKRAALFSALTGLRFSDIEKLTWSEVEMVNGEYCLKYKQKKTRNIEDLPISQQAADLLGDRSQVKPFEGLYYTYEISRTISRWMAAAEIKKKITFHCFRHTYATLQLGAGTDIYTVSKLLGHRNLATTQIYTHVLGEAKRAAANRVSIKSVKP